MKLIFSKRAFARWLESQPEGSIVGERRYVRSCPLANFLAESQLGQPQVGYAHWVDARGQSRPLPTWAQKFTRAIDSIKQPDDVSREEALETLRGLLAGDTEENIEDRYIAPLREPNAMSYRSRRSEYSDSNCVQKPNRTRRMNKSGRSH